MYIYIYIWFILFDHFLSAIHFNTLIILHDTLSKITYKLWFNTADEWTLLPTTKSK